MNDGVDFRKLWQSQPVEKGPGTRVPRFGLLEDMTVPVFAPLSPWRRVSYAVWAASLPFYYWRGGPASGWFSLATGWTALVVGLAGVCLALVQRDRTHEPRPEENIQSYRTALVNEFERQFKNERRILFLLCGGSIAISSLYAVARVLERQPPEYSELAGPVLVIGFIIWGTRMYRRAADAVRSRLKAESETDL
jgi:hypothetical protein